VVGRRSSVVRNQKIEAPIQTLQIALFVKLAIRRGDLAILKLPAKAEELLCYLLLRRGQPHTRDAPGAQSKKYLRQCFSTRTSAPTSGATDGSRTCATVRGSKRSLRESACWRKFHVS
jgi:hypothetical protein